MNQYRHLNQQLSIIGTVTEIRPQENVFVVETRGGSFDVHLVDNSYTDALRNLDDVGRLRERRDRAGDEGSGFRFGNQVFVGDLVAVNGVWHHHEGNERFDARAIYLPYSTRGLLQFEHTNWWNHQQVVMANKWLDDLFGDKRTYELDDFAALYRTNLNILGLPTDDDTQEMPTLARLLYGLCSVFFVTGDDRYFLAAKAGVRFQQDAFRSYSTDGRFCFWYSAIKRERYRNRRELAAQTWDDGGSMPLYEQIYGLAGLTFFYRITGDWEVLQDIRRTVSAMLEIWGDWEKHEDGTRTLNGFFSHIDPVTFRPDDASLRNDGRDNRLSKNWNSVGDHIPAYLTNLMLALDTLPMAGLDDAGAEDLQGFYADCELIFTTTARIIRDKFPNTDDSPFVQERFRKVVQPDGSVEDWVPDRTWGWQRDLGVGGHNLKIAWNLTRVANWYLAKGGDENAATAQSLFDLAETLGKSMGELAVDQIRSGVFDAVQRDITSRNPPLEFGWINSKDFWQQEQGILAYLILYGRTGDADFLKQARELSIFWNVYFLDRERSGVFFRVTDNGLPIVEGEYGNIGGHSKSGYHVFELAFLAHIYQMAYLPRKQRQHTTFALHFRPDPRSGLRTINCLPDAVDPQALEVQEVRIDGVPRPLADPKDFRIPLLPEDLGKKVVVRLWQSAEQHARLAPLAPDDDHLPGAHAAPKR